MVASQPIDKKNLIGRQSTLKVVFIDIFFKKIIQSLRYRFKQSINDLSGQIYFTSNSKETK